MEAPVSVILFPADPSAMARAIVSSPEAHIGNPALFRSAWTALKAARGQTVHPHRLHPAFQIAAATVPGDAA